MNIKHRVKRLEEKTGTGRESEALYISWGGNEGCKGKADKSFCLYRKTQADGGIIWLPCGEGCEGV